MVKRCPTCFEMFNHRELTCPACKEFLTILRPPNEPKGDELLKQVKRRQNLGLASHVFLSLLILTSMVCVSIGIVGQFIRYNRAEAELHRIEQEIEQEKEHVFLAGLGELLETLNAWTILLNLLVILILIHLFVPAIAVFPFFCLLVMRWRDPLNIVVLRPFSHENTSRTLRKLIRTRLSGLGFFYTLADDHIKQKWYIKYPIIIGQTSLFQFRTGAWRKIDDPSEVDELCERLEQRRRRILNWIVSWDKVFPIKCDNTQWQYCVGNLISYADVILVDLTGCKDNIVWEILACNGLGLMSNMILLAERESVNECSEFLINNGINTPHELIAYGLPDKKELDRLMNIVLSRISTFGKASYPSRA